MSKYTEAVRKFLRDPALFVRTLLDVDPLDWQAKAMRAVAEGIRRVSIRSGRRVGKTSLMSWLSLWFEMTRPDARTIVTSPSSAQLKDAYIPNFRQWAQRLPPEIYALWDIKAERFDFRMAERQGFENFVTVRTARQDSPESLQGINATNVLVLVDEAAGVADINFEALSGSLATGEGALNEGRAHMVLTGNPNRASGYFYDTHHILSEDWYTLHMSSEDCELVSEEWINEMRARWGEDSNAYRVQVLGRFPTEDEDTIIPQHLVDDAIGRDVEIVGPQIWGVDVARYGSDDTALAKRKGNGLLEPVKVWRDLDTMETSGRIKSEFDACPPQARPNEILVDVIGMGAGVVDRLRELGLPVRGINVSESPAMKTGFNKLRDELWFKCREWLEARDVTLPRDDRLAQELTMPRVRYTSTGKMKIEGKDEMKRRGKRSPDKADALVLTFASAAATAAHGWSFDSKKPIKRRIKGIV